MKPKESEKILAFIDFAAVDRIFIWFDLAFWVHHIGTIERWLRCRQERSPAFGDFGLHERQSVTGELLFTFVHATPNLGGSG